MIRDRIVCGINDNRIQRRLLQESELAYMQAFDIAQAMETASKDIQDLLRPVTNQTIQSLQYQKPKSPCYRCGGCHPSHTRFVECHSCGKKGHIAKVCCSKPTSRHKDPPKSKNSKIHPVAGIKTTTLEEDNSPDQSSKPSDNNSNTLFHTQRQGQPYCKSKEGGSSHGS